MAPPLNTVEVVTLFVTDIEASKAFYARVFGAPEVFGDEVSSVLNFSNLMINLLQRTQAPTLVTPQQVGTPAQGATFLLTIRVENVEAICADLAVLGITLLNGPIDRPWGRRTAAFADPDGFVWEVAQELPAS